MKDLLVYLLIIFVLLIHNVSSRHASSYNSQQQNRKYKSHSDDIAATTNRKHRDYQHKQREVNAPQPHLPELVEVDTLQCPVGCVCQYAHFMDLPISRWINHLQTRRPDKALDEEDTAEELINDNETAYEGDESFLENPFIKQATCILQEDSVVEDLVQSLPHDLQALIFLYTGIGRNKTVTTSVLKPLNQLTVLEIRGPQDRSFKLVFDEPLSFLLHANFESITLLGSDTFKRPKATSHPRDSFDYKPKIELDYYATESDSSAESQTSGADSYKFNLTHDILEDELEILPYDVYLQEVKKARMPTFYGWEHLELLRIHSCQLQELHWEMFDGLDALQHLSLERNAIEVVTALALFGANNIRTLSLAHNTIQDLHYRALGGLLQLESLNLSDNKLTKLSEMSFPPFPKLERADFRNNPIRYIFPATFGVMNNTRTLLFGSSEVALELWNNEPFQWLDKLQELDLGNVSIGNLEHNIFQGLTSLEVLRIKGSIRSLDFDAFADQTQMREIDLSDCGIQQISMDAFMGCKKLEVVNLARNNLSYIPPDLFDDQKSLEEVYLEGNNLTTLPTNFFYQQKLKLVRLIDNPWKCSCDMYNWRAKLTNQVRNGARIERCITDYRSGKRLSCYKVDNYQFDHRFAPRCENYNGRSVFYVVRKNLQCGQGRVVNNLVSGHKTKQMQREQRMNKLRKMQEHRESYATKLDQKKNPKPNNSLGQMSREVTSREKPQHSGNQSQRLVWQLKREEKIRRTLARENSIEHVLMQQQRMQAKLRKEHRVNVNAWGPTREVAEETVPRSDEDEEISNEI